MILMTGLTLTVCEDGLGGCCMCVYVKMMGGGLLRH